MGSHVHCPSRSRSSLAGVGLAAAVLAMQACGATEQVADKVNDDARQISVANEQMCAVNHRTIATAVEAATAMNGELPASIAEIVAIGLVREAPQGFDYAPTADGGYSITPTPGGPCEGSTP